MGNNPVIAGPVRIVALVEIVPPKSWSKARTAAAIVGDIKPTSRPDLDNYLKAALDAINGVVFADDSLVIELTAKKTFGLHSKLVLTVLPLAALSSNARAL
jgi:Holliday junction resolvase RusA-like endonuclease